MDAYNRFNVQRGPMAGFQPNQDEQMHQAQYNQQGGFQGQQVEPQLQAQPMPRQPAQQPFAPQQDANNMAQMQRAQGMQRPPQAQPVASQQDRQGMQQGAYDFRNRAMRGTRFNMPQGGMR